MPLEHKLLLDLPPFAPDYSGVCSALFELGGLLVIHDASGCTGNYTGFDEPRWFGSNSAVFSSGIREMDAVMGDDEHLIEKVLAACADLDPKFVALMGSPVPMVIGTDFDGVAAEISARTGLTTLAFNTKGFAYYDRGIADAYKRLESLLVKEKKRSVPDSVNIMGASPLDFGTTGAIDDVRAVLGEAGMTLTACWTMGSSLDELANCAEASLNLVVSWSGLSLARRLQSRFGIPYLTGFPVGSKAKEPFRTAIAAALAGNAPPPPAAQSAPADVLIIGEQIAANSLRETLERSGRVCSVATMFSLDETLARAGDKRMDSEVALRNHIGQGGFAVIVGDPLYEPFNDGRARFVPLPHIAVSGRLYWNEKLPLAGDGADVWLKENFS